MLQVKDTLKPPYQIAAQNSWVKGTGAYTGEIAPELLVDLGIGWATWQLSSLDKWHRSHAPEANDTITASGTASAGSMRVVGHTRCSLCADGLFWATRSGGR
jgi:Triosephosphate isomerase